MMTYENILHLSLYNVSIHVNFIKIGSSMNVIEII